MLIYSIIQYLVLLESFSLVLVFNNNNNNNRKAKRSINYCMSYQPYCECKSNEKIECRHFNDLSRLNFRTKQIVPNHKRIHLLKLEPLADELVVFDAKLNLTGLIFDQAKFHLILNHFDGIELDANVFANFNNFQHYTTSTAIMINPPRLHLNKLFLTNFNLKFFYRANPDFNWICDLVIQDTRLMPLFASFRSIYLGVAGGSVNYSTSLCPAIFKNARIDSLYFNNLTLTNRPRFLQFNLTQNELNCEIKAVHIQSSEVRLDTTLLDPSLFRHIEKLSIEFSNLTSIETFTFRGLKNLRYLNLWLFNLKWFLQSSSSSNEWLAYLNYNVDEVSRDELTTANHLSHKYLFVKQIYIELNDEKSGYDYPDRDFCLFKYFPHSKLVFPIVNSNVELNCTCTLAWLLQYWRFSFKNIKTTCTAKCFSSNFSQFVEQCQFDHKITKCFENTFHDGQLISAFLRDLLLRKKNLPVTSGHHRRPQPLVFLFLVFIFIKQFFI